ncbi:MAG: succinate dehydrogenase cytochrome b subunit [Verrucomicrobiota bacterium]|nr:succinate dehydrogenase cytochrome b subunit [Verrucomicrobiota bacterium]
MHHLAAFFKSSIGRKWIVALTGIVLVGYVIGHLLGNLQVFLPPEHINAYAAFLKGTPELLWLARAFLLAAVVAHLVFTIQLAFENRSARPQRYVMQRAVQSRLSTKTMMWTGSYLLCFIIVHLMHFTTQSIHPEYRTWIDASGRPDVYRMMVVGFSDPLMSGFYILGMILLCAHLSHGIGSLFQTLGLRSKGAAAFLTRGGRVLAIALAIGYISIPVAVLTGRLGRQYVEQRAALDAQKLASTGYGPLR